MYNDISQSLSALQLEDSASADTTSKMILPADIMSIILKSCDQSTCLAVLYTCRSYHSIALPHVYKEITISTPRQLRGLIYTSHQAEYDDRIAKRFYHTRSLFYRVKQGSSATSSSKAGQAKLYTTLRNVSSHCSDGKVLFPNLDTASFEQVPAGGDHCAYKPTFLTNVKTVHLEYSPLAMYDLPPNLSALGMRDVREIHMYHLAGCEVSHKSTLDTYIGYQGSLEKVHFHLSGHFENTVCSDQYESRVHTLVNGTLRDTGITRTRRSIDTTIYIREYALAIAMVSAFVSYAQTTAASRPHRFYPSLKQVIVDVGSDRIRARSPDQADQQSLPANVEEYTDRQLMVMQSKNAMIAHRQLVEQRLAQATHASDTTASGITFPDLCILEGQQGTACILPGEGSIIEQGQTSLQSPPNFWQPLTNVSQFF